MVEETNPSNENNIQMSATAYGDSKVTQIGQLNAAQVQIVVERIEPVLERFQQISQPESAGFLQAGNPHKTVAYWQGREEEIAKLGQWLTDKNTFLIGIEGIGGTGKSMLAAKIYEKIEELPKRFWADVSYGASFSDLARQVLTEFGFRVPEEETKLCEALVKCLQSGKYLLIIDNLESLLQPDRHWGSQFYGDLSELQKTLLLNISVYRGAVDSAAAVAVLPGSLEAEIEGELRNLVKRSLLLEKLDERRRFEFQPVVLEYVRYKAGDQTEAHQRAINYYLLNVKQKPWQTKEDIKEYLEIFSHWYQLEKYDSAFEVLEVCYDFFKLQGYYRDQVDLYQQLIEAWEKTGDRKNRSYQTALTDLGTAYNSLGKYQQAIEFDQKSLEIKRKIGDRYGEAASLNNLGNPYLSLGKYQQAIEFYQQSLEITREIGDREKEGNFLNNLGITYLLLGQYQQAIEFYQQSLKITREIGDRKGEATSLSHLGITYKVLEQYQKAIEFHQQSLEIDRVIGYRIGEVATLINLGMTYKALGQYEKAIEFHQQSLNIAREISDRNGEANAWYCLGQALKNINRESDALGAYRNARELYQAMGIDAQLQQCNNAIERLSQPKAPVVSRHGFWGWLHRLWRWLCTWFRR